MFGIILAVICVVLGLTSIGLLGYFVLKDYAN